MTASKNDPMPASGTAGGRDTDPDAVVLARIRQAVHDYHLALDRPEHGGLAQDRALREIQTERGLPWVQGAELAHRQAAAKDETEHGHTPAADLASRPCRLLPPWPLLIWALLSTPVRLGLGWLHIARPDPAAWEIALLIGGDLGMMILMYQLVWASWHQRNWRRARFWLALLAALALILLPLATGAGIRHEVFYLPPPIR